MKKIILIIATLILLVTACTNNNGTDVNSDNTNNNISDNTEDIEKPNTYDKIDRSEYLTGEIITDGNYSFPSHYIGLIYFVPDVERSEIIKEKYNVSKESIQLEYDDEYKVEKIPKDLGIYKVKVKIEFDGNNKSFSLNDIQLTDKIGTVAYQGKTYETNELDENVKVKDKVCGLIVKWILRDRDAGGIQIRFAGEIESEGYYFINYDEMNFDNFGRIYFDEKYFDNIPKYIEKGFNNFCFANSNENFDKLKNYSAFGKGKFKTSNYTLIYNIGMGRPLSDYLTEIISLDENYKNMIEFNRHKYVDPVGVAKDFIIISSVNYDDNSNYIATDFYYINKNKPEKIFLFNAAGYQYDLKLAANENEFILSTEGFNYVTGKVGKVHTIIFKITENGVVNQKVEGLNIDSDNLNEEGKKFNMQGYVEDIKIIDTKVIISIKDVKMREQDALAFGKTLNKDDLLNIQIVDNNRTGPFIKVGDKIAVSTGYTKDAKTLYTFGADIGLRN